MANQTVGPDALFPTIKTNNTTPTAPATTPTATPAPAPAVFTKEQMEVIQHLAVTTSIAVSNANKGMATVQGAPRGNQLVKEECPVCRQYVSACKGEHVSMVVYPVKYAEFMPYFPGIKINGVLYVSNTSSETVQVPKCAVSFINNAIHEFEQNEKTILTPRNKIHNSGSIGNRGKGAKAATSAWR